MSYLLGYIVIWLAFVLFITERDRRNWKMRAERAFQLAEAAIAGEKNALIGWKHALALETHSATLENSKSNFKN